MDSNEMAANPMNRRYSFSNKTLWLKGRIFRPSPDVWLLLKGPSNCTQRRRVNIGNIATAAHSLRLYLSLSASQHIVFDTHTFSGTLKNNGAECILDTMPCRVDRRACRGQRSDRWERATPKLQNFYRLAQTHSFFFAVEWLIFNMEFKIEVH